MRLVIKTNSMKRFIIFVLASVALVSCAGSVNHISRSTIDATVAEILSSADNPDTALVMRGVSQAAALWTEDDGTQEEFRTFISSHYAAGAEAKKTLFDKLSHALELFAGSYDIMNVELLRPLHLDCGPIGDIDNILGSYSPSAHYIDDMFGNKTAFITILNFPNYTLEEKNTLGREWSRLEWAYARMGDVFTCRIPAAVAQKTASANSEAENYIAGYNIMMGHLLTEDGRRLFPEDMCLLSHWNLRDELKSNYAGVPDAAEKQEMIYKVMERIACQEIPEVVIDDPQYDWMPFSNRVFRNGEEITAEREPDTRYRKILDIFEVFLEEDGYCPAQPTAIQRNFDGIFEISDTRIENLFTGMLTSPQFSAVAAVVRERLGRDLRPYDIWYDGFKSRSTIPEDELSAKTRRLYPDAEAFGKDTPRILRNIGFSPAEADYIASRVKVEDARGSGHAWPCLCRWEPALLRTRIPDGGMDYKGYNIACHEFGHNVEMILDLYHIDHYTLAGVPNTAFTEAMAFLFQNRDLQFLGYGRQTLDSSAVLDSVWGMFEIMGVSLVDMYMWRWLYANSSRTITAAELCVKTVDIAREVWNTYFGPVIGTYDSPVLAIYSHMVNSPMYLPNYPLGHLIHFQIEQHLASCATDAEFAAELSRIYELGRLTPDEWMRRAFGVALSIEPTLAAVDTALKTEL